MTKIILTSDSHGLEQPLINLYDYYKDETNHFLHCGDSQLDKNHLLWKHYQSVKGNCDKNGYPSELFFTIAGKKILITHGHQFHVKFNLNRLYYYALEKGADLVFFGHTHRPFFKQYKGITFVNPGSISSNRGKYEQSFAIVEIENNAIKVNHYNVNEYQKMKTTG